MRKGRIEKLSESFEMAEALGSDTELFPWYEAENCYYGSTYSRSDGMDFG